MSHSVELEKMNDPEPCALGIYYKIGMLSDDKM